MVVDTGKVPALSYAELLCIGPDLVLVEELVLMPQVSNPLILHDGGGRDT